MSRELVVHQPWFESVPRSGYKPTLAGYLVLVVGVFGFGGWAATAPIDGAVVSPGTFVATTQNKIVQHLEGGIIKNILVREGEQVRAGQPLILLDDTLINADLARLQLRQTELIAQKARLEAEANVADVLSFPDDLGQSNNPADVNAVRKAQRDIFQARQRKLTEELAILESSVEAFGHRMNGDASRLSAVKAQLALIDEEFSDKDRLYKKGLVRKPEYLALKRAKENLIGEVGRLEAELRDSQQRIDGAEHQRARLRLISVQAAVEELRGVEAELKDIRERIISASSVMSRLRIDSPVDGTVVRLNYHTAGGVIKPGNDILELLPSGDELVIEARVRPQDIDNIAKGQDAIVRLTALNQRVTPMITGQVIYVSADSIPDERPGGVVGSNDNAYLARVKLDPDKAAEIKDFLPTPGMPAEVFIKTGERTFFQYLMQPVEDTMARAFREK